VATVEVDVRVYCTCGEELDGVTDNAGDVIVDLCQKCIDSARDEGYSEGYTKCEDDNRED